MEVKIKLFDQLLMFKSMVIHKLNLTTLLNYPISNLQNVKFKKHHVGGL